MYSASDSEPCSQWANVFKVAFLSRGSLRKRIGSETWGWQRDCLYLTGRLEDDHPILMNRLVSILIWWINGFHSPVPCHVFKTLYSQLCTQSMLKVSCAFNLTYVLNMISRGFCFKFGMKSSREISWVAIFFSFCGQTEGRGCSVRISAPSSNPLAKFTLVGTWKPGWPSCATICNRKIAQHSKHIYAWRQG